MCHWLRQYIWTSLIPGASKMKMNFVYGNNSHYNSLHLYFAAPLWIKCWLLQQCVRCVCKRLAHLWSTSILVVAFTYLHRVNKITYIKEPLNVMCVCVFKGKWWKGCSRLPPSTGHEDDWGAGGSEEHQPRSQRHSESFFFIHKHAVILLLYHHHHYLQQVQQIQL